ncbi:unnamed protein product [Penicillium crustosum]
MPTTRQKRKDDDPLLPGLPETKRPRSDKGAGSTSGRKPAAQKGKKGPRDEPITDPTNLPKGWTASELDLDDDDVDGQIARCLRRIDEKILPDIFENRLKMYQQIKQKQIDMINSEPDGLSWEVVQRLDSLKRVQKSFYELGNDSDNIPNVKAIMAAYRSGDLVWDANSVTYWAHGKLIGGPRKNDVDEFLAFSKEHGPHGVWVEGTLSNLRTAPNIDLLDRQLQTGTDEPVPHFAADSLWARHASIAIRNPTTWNINTREHTMFITVMEDSGASAMKIFQEDRLSLERMSGAPLPISGMMNMSTAGGLMEADTVVLQVNMFHNGQVMLPRWINLRACIARQRPNTPPTGVRLSGIWLHHMLYCLSAPDNTGDMYVGTDLSEILTQLPPCIPAFANPPPT